SAQPERYLGDRDQVVTAEPADVALDSAFLVGALAAWLAVESLETVVRPEGGPSRHLGPRPGQAQHGRHRALEVVVADMPERHAAQDRERVHVAFQEGLLTARGGHLVDGPARVRQPQRE